MTRLLILGGTTEASRLVAVLAGRPEIAATLSLAGRTETPKPAPVPTRIGGFGGVAGLAAYLKDHHVDVLVDATHPFAARISAHAVAASRATGRPLAIFSRPPWKAQPGDAWHEVPDLEAAAVALGEAARTVFLTSGRLGLAAFRTAPQHRYILRSIDPPAPEDRPPRCEVLLARGPFDTAAETDLMRRHAIEVLVSKNSGGPAGAPKLAAARALRLPVVMVARPPEPADPPPAFADLDALLDWIEHHGRASARPAP